MDKQTMKHLFQTFKIQWNFKIVWFVNMYSGFLGLGEFGMVVEFHRGTVCYQLDYPF